MIIKVRDDDKSRREIEEAIEEVNGSQEKAKKMVEMAILSMKAYKEEAAHKATENEKLQKKNYDLKVHDELSTKSQMRGNYRIRNNVDVTSQKLLDDDTWFNAGYVYTNSPDGLSIANQKVI